MSYNPRELPPGQGLNSRRERREQGLKILQSLGIMLVTMSYLTPLEQTHTQHICVWLYNHGTGRAQRTIKLRLPYLYFTIQATEATVVKYDHFFKE